MRYLALLGLALLVGCEAEPILENAEALLATGANVATATGNWEIATYFTGGSAVAVAVRTWLKNKGFKQILKAIGETLHEQLTDDQIRQFEAKIEEKIPQKYNNIYKWIKELILGS